MRSDSLDIARAAVRSASSRDLTLAALRDPRIRRVWERASLVYLVAVGKASAAMAATIARAAGGRLAAGIVVTNVPDEVAGLTVLTGDHPVPGRRSQRAAAAVLSFLRDRRFSQDELVVFAVSGGTSALLAMPVSPLTLNDLQVVTAALLQAGIDVTRINDLRRELSAVHGGKLLTHCDNASILGLVLCDNVQVGPQAVGSGLSYPSAPDTARASATLGEISDELPPPLAWKVRAALAQSHGCPAAPALENVCIGGPDVSIVGALQAANQADYRVVSLGAHIQGEAREVAAEIGGLARSLVRNGWRPGCIVACGEVTVTVTGNGTGGRCQELAWAMIPYLTGIPGASFTALASDGQDFLPGTMGARVTAASQEMLAAAGVDWAATLAGNNTHGPLHAHGWTIPAVRTDTNVCDVYVLTWGADQPPTSALSAKLS